MEFHDFATTHDVARWLGLTDEPAAHFYHQMQGVATQTHCRGVLGTLFASALQGHRSGREDRRLAGALVESKHAAKARSESAKEGNALVVENVCEQRTAGATSQTIADKLNGEGHVTRRGNSWTAQMVFQLVKRECR